MTIDPPWTLRRLGTRTLNGPNVHYRRTVCVLTVGCGPLAAVRIVDLGGDVSRQFAARFGDLPPSRAGHGLGPRRRSTLGDPGVATVPDLLLEAVLALEHFAARSAGRFFTPEFAQCRVRDAEEGHVDLIWESATSGVSNIVSRAALAGVLDVLSRCDERIDGSGLDAGWEDALAALCKRCERTQWSPLAALFAAGARDARLPHEGLAGSYIRFGEGSRQRLLSEEVLDRTLRSHAAVADRAISEITSVDEANRMGRSLLDSVVDATHEGPVPKAMILGVTGTRAVARALDRYLRARGVAVGRVAGNRAVIAGRPIPPTERGRSPSSDFVLRDPRVAFLVRADSPRRILRRGLGLERLDVLAWLGARVDEDPHTTWSAVEVALQATAGPVVVDGQAHELDAICEVVGSERVIVVGDATSETSCRVVRCVEDADRIELWCGTRLVSSLVLSEFLRAGHDPNTTNLRWALFAAGLAIGLGYGGPEPEVS